MLKSPETIIAPASGKGHCGISVIRLSGSKAAVWMKVNTRRKFKETPRHAQLLSFYERKRKLVDEIICVYYPGPYSYTGEDVIEINCHGNPLIVETIVDTFLSQGVRLAKPGEFTERAFLNGKMALNEAEAVLDIIHAQSMDLARAAQASLQGYFSKKVKEIATHIEKVRVVIEANIDFVDQELEYEALSFVRDQAKVLKEKLERLIEATKVSLSKQEAMKILIAGEPNVGKSTLINNLSQKDLAIVTEIAGTTRDLISTTLSHQGVVFEVTDSAGLRETEDIIENEGIKRVQEKAKEVDCIWWIADGLQEGGKIPFEDHAHKTILVRNKMDLYKDKMEERVVDDGVKISAKEGLGFEALWDKTYEMTVKGDGPPEFFAKKRHLESLKQTLAGVQAALETNELDELMADHFAYSQERLAEILGEYHTEDLLGAIFSTYCLGK